MGKTVLTVLGVLMVLALLVFLVWYFGRKESSRTPAVITDPYTPIQGTPVTKDPTPRSR